MSALRGSSLGGKIHGQSTVLKAVYHHLQEVIMGEERDKFGKKANEEPDVEAHKFGKKANEEPGDEAEDERPDVEAHKFGKK